MNNVELYPCQKAMKQNRHQDNILYGDHKLERIRFTCMIASVSAMTVRDQGNNDTLVDWCICKACDVNCPYIGNKNVDEPRLEWRQRESV